MWPGRIALIIVLIWSAFCLALAGIVFFNIGEIESPERYLALLIGAVMLYMGGAPLAGLIWPPKEKDPNAPIEIPPLDQVRGRTSYRDDTAWMRNGMLAIGAIFLFVSLIAAEEHPIVLVIALIAVGILAGAGVMIWRQIQYGRARLELAAPPRRGDSVQGMITMSGFGWTVVDRDFDVTVELRAIQSFRGSRSSSSVVVARAHAITSTTRDGKTMTIRFTTQAPIIDTSAGRFSWNIQLETGSPAYRVTFLIDVA